MVDKSFGNDIQATKVNLNNNKSNFDSYINLIHEIKEIKNTNNTFLVKLSIFPHII